MPTPSIFALTRVKLPAPGFATEEPSRTATDNNSWSRNPLARRCLAPLLLAGVILCCPTAVRAAGDIDCTPQAVDRIAPGTRIADRAPEGYTHLVFKTYSKLSTGDIEALPDFAKQLAEFLFTAMVARVGTVEQGKTRSYRLETVDLGVGTRIGEHDVVVTGPTQKQLGANLGPFKQVILGRAEEHLGKMRRVAASEVMMLVDAPTVMSFDGQNRAVVLRYLFLVEPTSGYFAPIVWRIELDAAGAYRAAVGSAVLVQANLVTTSPLHVDGKKVSYFGIPGAEAFAVKRLPPGTTFAIPSAVRSVAGRAEMTPAGARQLETDFRQVLGLPAIGTNVHVGK